MFTIPQLQIQSDFVEVYNEVIDKASNPESVWLRLNNKSYSLQISSKSSIVSPNNNLSIVPIRSALFKLNVLNRHIYFHFPKQYYSNTTSLNLTNISITNNFISIGTTEGSLILSTNPPSLLLPRKSYKIHIGDIVETKFFPSGEVLLTIGLDTIIKLWSVKSLKSSNFENPLRTFKNIHKKRVTCADMIGKGRNVVSGGLDGRIVIWECGKGEAVWVGRRIKNLNDSILCMIITGGDPDDVELDGKFWECKNKVLWCGHESGIVSVWNLGSRLSVGEFDVGNSVESIDKVGKYGIIVGLEGGIVKRYEYDINIRQNNMLWECQVEEKIDKDETIHIKRVRVVDDTVFILTGNLFVKLSAENGQLLEYFVGYDETVNDFQVYDTLLWIVGKRGSFISYNL